MKEKVIIVSGYFNPIHKGHLEYFLNAKQHADKLFVIVNNDHQRALKGSKEFQDENERLFIVSQIKPINASFSSIDKDRTVRKSIEKIVNDHSDNFDFIFANGGDQDNQSIPEAEICNELDVKLLDGLGDKIQSSSWLLKK
mgnify:CR=1 FL=1